MNIAQKGLIFIIRIYQLTLSPVLTAALGPSARCRFTPSCSQYAREVVGLHGAVRGGCLAAGRLCRCHPWGDFGEDLPPPVRAHLPPHAQEIYLGAFNNAWTEYAARGPEQREITAHRVAWAAVKRKYEKSGDQWVPRESG